MLEFFYTWHFCLILGAYILAKIAYRLYFHPLSKIPGPKVTAITHLYEFYHNVVYSGKFLFKIEQMHQKYGKPLPTYYYSSHTGAKIYLLQDLSFASIPEKSILVTRHSMKKYMRQEAIRETRTLSLFLHMEFQIRCSLLLLTNIIDFDAAF